jgi:DNA-binding SARP family transcriptional activator
MSRRPGGSSKRSDVDAFTQAFYRRVMLGYQRLGRPAEALSAWRRCQRTLSAGLGISPSPETEAIARQSQQQ